MRVLKTPMMLLIEARDPEGRDIRQIMIDAYRKHGNFRAAAASIGITHAAFGAWVYRLNIKLDSASIPSPAA